MLIRIITFLSILILTTACTTQQIQDTLGTVLTTGNITSEEAGAGLKEALKIGITKGADRLSTTDGYYKSTYKILLPQEARQITDKLQRIPGFRNVEEVILEKINRGAEDAAKRAGPIFISAIKQMTFQDALNILMGEDDAATQYLHRVTYDKLYNEFNPVIVNSLDKFNARQYWGDAVNKYNSIPLTTKLNPDLDDHVTKEALEGLFAMVTKEERNIRKNVAARTTDLLRRVFAKQDNR